jgi:hypothetical protein
MSEHTPYTAVATQSRESPPVVSFNPKEIARGMNTSLVDIQSGNVETVSHSRGNEMPSSLFHINECGAIPISLSKIRGADRDRAEAHLSARVTLGSKTLEDSFPSRLRAAYRIISTAARITGDLGGEGLLSSSIPPGAWYCPSKPYMSGMRTGLQTAFTFLQAMRDAPNTATMISVNGEVESFSGITYLPPPIPDKYFPSSDPYHIASLRSKGHVPEGYNPENDEGLCMWLDAMDYIAYFLGVNRGTDTHPEYGVYGLLGMLGAKTARLVWPCRDDILNFEQELMFYIIDLILKRDVKSTLGSVLDSPDRILQKELGLNRFEALMLCKSAAIYMHHVFSEDPEQMRARELQRLNVLADRCTDSNDPRAELAVAKQRQLLMGLTNTTESENVQEFRDLARREIEEQESLEL